MTTKQPSPKASTTKRTATPSPELDASLYDELDEELNAAEAAEYDDFDAFWASRTQVRPARIRGEIVTPPTDVPLAMLDELAEVENSEKPEDVKRMLARIFGGEVFDKWVDAGMGLEEFQVVLAWAGAHMRGTPCTFAEAVELYLKARAEQAGKARARPPKAKGGRAAAQRSRSK